MLAASAAMRNGPTMNTLMESTFRPLGGFLTIRRIALLLRGCRHGEDQHSRRWRQYRPRLRQGADAGDPHHRRGGVADDAASASRVRGRHDRREIADMNLAWKQLAPRAADQGRGDLSRKLASTNTSTRRMTPPSSRRAAAPAFVGNSGSPRNAATAAQIISSRQIGQRHPFMRHVVAEATKTGTVFEAGVRSAGRG